MKTRAVLVLMISFLVAPPLFAQQKTITGRVTSEQGASLSGVTVSVKGTANTTSTNTQGDYSIAAAAGQTRGVAIPRHPRDQLEQQRQPAADHRRRPADRQPYRQYWRARVR